MDRPPAAPSIMAGVNQTIMPSLSGFAILFCAMIPDRVVQGRRP